LVITGPDFRIAAEEPTRPTFTLRLADGTVVAGPIEQIDDNWSIRLVGDKPVRATGLQAIELRREKASPPPGPRNEHVILANGDRLPGTVRELTGDRLLIRANLGKEADLNIPLSAVSAIWVVAPESEDNADKGRRRLAALKRSRDTASLRNGDIVEGTLNAINPKSRDVQIESAKKDVTIPFSKIAVIALNSELVRPLQPKGVRARLVLQSGCRLTLDSARAGHGVLTGKTGYGVEVTIPLDQILAIDWLGGCATYLSDLKPRSYLRSVWGGVSWPYVNDASVMETDLRFGGELFDKGLGMHTSSRLTYTIGSDDAWFEARVGLDDGVGREGHARIQVLLNGKPQKLAWDGYLTWKKGPRDIRLPVSGAKELTLVSDFGDYGDVQGCVDWANARIIRNPK